jgi:hypothetical protein
VAKIIDRNDSYHQKTVDFNSALQTEISSLPFGQSAKVILVDLYSALGDWSSTYFLDAIHPNDTGNGLMANTWFNTLQNNFQPDLAVPSDGAGNQSTDITLTWNAPPAANGSTVYQLQVSTNNQFTDIILDDQNVVSTWRLVSGLIYGQQYYWRVRILGYGWSDVRNFTTEDEPTPVELSTFVVKTLGRDIELFWQTKTEINNYGFEIERLAGNIEADAGSWEKIGFIKGNGNSNSPKDYYYVDGNLTGGSKFLYRLKQIDNDGKFTYSEEVYAEIIPYKYELFQNYPNPFNPETNINFTLPFAGRVRLDIYNIIGEHMVTLLDKDMEAGFHSILFKENNLTSGTYIYRIQANDFSQTKKMLLIK